MPKRLIVHALLMSVVALIGCSSTQRFYNGPELPPEEVAIVRPNPVAAKIGFLVTSVDGVDAHVQMEEFALRPGAHEIGLRVTPTSMREWGLISGEHAHIAHRYDMENRIDRFMTIEVEAGRRYGLGGQAAWNGRIESFWLYDIETSDVMTRVDEP